MPGVGISISMHSQPLIEAAGFRDANRGGAGLAPEPTSARCSSRSSNFQDGCLPLGSPPLRTVALRIASCPQLDAPTSQVGASTGTNFQPPVASNPATSQPLTTAPRNIAKHRHLLSTHPRHPLPSQLLPARYTPWPSVTTKVIDLRCAKNNPLSNHQSWMGISGVTQAAAVGPEGLGPGTPSFKMHR